MNKKIKKVVAITSCPTGVAHTFMAAKGLEQEAKKRNIKIKVQKNAQGGVEDKLSTSDIKECDAVIIASDIKVDLAPFNGKPLIQVPVKQGFTKTKQIFDKLEKGDFKIHKQQESKSQDVNLESSAAKTFKQESKEIGKKSYVQLLTGISYMLPFVIAGGILIAISFFWGIWSFDKEGHPDEYVAFAASLKTIGDAAFGLMVPILAGYIAYSIGDRPALVPGMVGGWIAQSGFDGKTSGFLGAIIAGYLAGWTIFLLRKGTFWIPRSISSVKPMIIYPLISTLFVGLIMIWGINVALDPLFNTETGIFTNWLNNMQNGSKIVLAILLGILISVDFGGPVNKVAYMFGVATLTIGTDGYSIIMACVSAGCMTPPIATFFATVMFRKNFSPQERQAGYVNLLLGAFHITEGAIPFAAKKPWVNIPIFMVGSVTACLISILLNVSTPAPHGGVVVIALVHNWYYWLLAIFAGAFASGVLLGLFSKSTPASTQTVVSIF